MLKNVKHEQFAQLCATGLSRAESYRRVAGERAGKNSDANSDDWLNARGVRERVQELQERNAERSEITREEAMRWLADLIGRRLGRLARTARLCRLTRKIARAKWRFDLVEQDRRLADTMPDDWVERTRPGLAQRH